ncbi:hypothetical protein V8C34DRAFT_281260 [Trichoderma compactum]
MGFNSPLQQGSQQYHRWIEHGGEYQHTYMINDSSDLFPLTTPVFGACAFGLYYILQGWWQAGVNISQVNEGGLDLLAIAARNGHQHLCEKLIGSGADVNRMLCGGTISPLPV